VQDPMVESAKKCNFLIFGLLELEMADLRCFFEKNGLGPLGINYLLCIYFKSTKNILLPF
jgi:hypothetical protein